MTLKIALQHSVMQTEEMKAEVCHNISDNFMFKKIYRCDHIAPL